MQPIEQANIPWSLGLFIPATLEGYVNDDKAQVPVFRSRLVNTIDGFVKEIRATREEGLERTEEDLLRTVLKAYASQA